MRVTKLGKPVAVTVPVQQVGQPCNGPHAWVRLDQPAFDGNYDVRLCVICGKTVRFKVLR